jgi:hypothetical protein
MVAKGALRQRLGVDEDIRLGACSGLNARDKRVKPWESHARRGDHPAGRHLAGRDYGDVCPAWARQVLRWGGGQDVEAQETVGLPGSDLARSTERRGGDLQVRDHRAALLA